MFNPPLSGLLVLEFAGLAPGPFAGLLLADAGARVLRIDRPVSAPGPVPSPDLLTRRKASVAIDLKEPNGVSLIRALARKADVLIDPFRPGVLDKLGLGPDDLCSDNPRLVYARLSGFRRDGRYAHMAGHDVNYLAVSGVLALLGRANEAPYPPLNLLADFAGGGAMLVLGILMALLVREREGRGQTVEANMVDGSAYLATFSRFALKTPVGGEPRGHNFLDGGAPFYDTYETADGKHVAVGALEPRFFKVLMRGLGLEGQGWEERQSDRNSWSEMRRLFVDRFKTRTRDEWGQIFDQSDACYTPVLGFEEMEADEDKLGGDQRPPVTLRETPLLAVGEKPEYRILHGQDPGVSGRGYEGVPLSPGKGGEQALKHWYGLVKGRDYRTKQGGLVLNAVAKI